MNVRSKLAKQIIEILKVRGKKLFVVAGYEEANARQLRLNMKQCMQDVA